MEASPRLPPISFDLKLAIESVNLCEKFPNYITVKYQENAENFTGECELINRLRQNAINCTMDESGLHCLKRYFCQLLLLRNRFPMLPDTECAVQFSWEDAYQKEDCIYHDIRFEESCILYNIGALYSKLGANENRRTHESMKNACTYFRYSAACFEKLRDQYTPYSVDLTPDLLTCQVDILLGQAHEAVLEKSILDHRPASVNAHIAMQISEYYQRAQLNLMKPGIHSIVSKRFREWRVCLTYKFSYYLAITYYCCGLVAEENKKHGEAVCYFENALERLKEGWKNAEKISTDKTAIFKEIQTFAHDILAEKYKLVKRDNDNVYFEKVPSLSSLPAVQGAVVAKSQAFDCHDPDVSGPDIFQKLVPMDAHLATSEYSEEKAKLLREMIELIDQKNQELQTFLSCLQLDRIPLTNDYLHLPRELLDCCAQINHQSDLSKNLMSIMQQLQNHHDDINQQILQLEQSLGNWEENSHSNIPKQDYEDLQSNIKTMREMIIQADRSNSELHQHMTTIIEHMNILSSPLEDLEKTLPKITELSDEINKPKFARLGLLTAKIETMKNQRETLLIDLRQKFQNDDITKLVLMRRQENHKSLFAEQIKKHEDLINSIKQNCTAQENILQALTEANADIADIRTNLITTFDHRQQLIRDYIHSFKTFDNTLSKANEGIQFYQKQSAKVNSLNDRLTTLQSQQQQQQVKTTTPHSPSNIPTIPDRPRLKDYLATMKPETWGSTKLDENIYKPSPMPCMNSMNNPYYPSSNVPNSSQQFSMPYLPFGYQPHPNYMVPPPTQPLPPQTIYPPSSTQTIPMYPSTLQNPSMYQYPQSLPLLPTNFDPYRPQPVGAYDIPPTQPPMLINPQDVYRPGGLLGMAQQPIINPNQFVQYVSPSSSSSVASSFANLSINPMSNH